MAALQGLKRLKEGVKRKLTKSEIKRGYVFVTLDKEVKKILGDGFVVHIGGDVFENKNIDSSGRISIGKELTKKLVDKTLTFKLNGSRLVIE